ncbi:secretion protein HlyD [Sulfuriferula sp. AH1]|nr:secretion protein HlyD [Sulfuriferula sp. AH1]
MIRRYMLPLLAMIGVLIIIVAIIIDNQPKQSPSPAIQWPKAPFATYVAGAGIVEASSGNVAVGTGVSGIVTAIYVKWGDRVRAGDLLFKIDDRDLQAQRLPAIASAKEAGARLIQARDQLKLAENVPDSRAISKEDMNNRHSAVAIAETALALAQARIEQIKLEIDRRAIRALIPGKILQINIRPGEFAQSGVPARPLMLLGNDDQLYLRVDIDEFDALRVKPGSPAVAFVRGAPERQVPLKFERIEPYVVPKTSLTGNGAERVDTRVLQVIYSFPPAALPVYIGQQMDVYIETSPAEPAQAPHPDARAVRQTEHAS